MSIDVDDAKDQFQYETFWPVDWTENEEVLIEDSDLTRDDAKGIMDDFEKALEAYFEDSEKEFYTKKTNEPLSYEFAGEALHTVSQEPKNSNVTDYHCKIKYIEEEDNQDHVDVYFSITENQKVNGLGGVFEYLVHNAKTRT